MEDKKTQHAAWKKRWRRENPEKARRHRDLVLVEKRLLKSGVCTDCGQNRPPCAMEWDHVSGEKAFKISYPISSSERIEAEIAKCELVCVLCHRDRTHRRYVRSNSRTAKARRTLHKKVAALKAGPCVKCGQSYAPWQMDFDHIDPSEKSEKICNMVRRRASWAAIEAEIGKCRLLCALCHRLHTEEQARALG